MKLGISIVLGPATLFIGLPRCRFSSGRGRQARRKPPAKEAETEDVVTSASAKPTARDTVSSVPAFQLDPAVRQDSISALITLGFPKRQAQVRVDGVKSGSSTEEVIKAALQRGGRP
jgi:hypothetical protein